MNISQVCCFCYDNKSLFGKRAETDLRINLATFVGTDEASRDCIIMCVFRTKTGRATSYYHETDNNALKERVVYGSLQNKKEESGSP